MPQRIIFRVVLVSALLIIPIGIYFVPGVVAAVFGVLGAIAPLWLPPLLFALLAPLWILYARSQFVASIPYVTLELKPGPDTPKTARAMELIFYSLYHRTDISRVMAILVGQVRLPWSFEIAAADGTVRFFIRIPTAHRQAIESRLRAEYRDVDIDEARDYAREVGFNPFTMKLAAREYIFEKPDPYPLRTYEEYEADAGASPLQKLLETLVSVGEGERFYLAFIARPHQRERRRLWEEPSDALYDAARREIAAIVGASGSTKSLPEQKQKLVAGIEAALKKPSFDVGIRALYLVERTSFREEHAALLDTLLAGFADSELNGFRSIDPRDRFSWPLSDIAGAVPGLAEMYLLDIYRRRAFFAPPYYGTPSVLNTAELATVYHLPNVGRASALARGHGARLEPPENLPV